MWRGLEEAETVDEMNPPLRGRLRTLWSGFGTSSEEVYSTRIQLAVNNALQTDVCPLSFAARLYRLGVFERQDNVLSSNIPTPLTLPQLEERLVAREEQQTLREGESVRPRGRRLTEMSSHDLEKASSDTMSLIEAMLPKFKDADIAMLVSWLLTGVETNTHMTDWSKKPNREEVAIELLNASGGDPSKINTVKLVDDYQGLMYHYYHKGAKTPREALIMLLDEFRMLTDEQRLMIRLRQNRPLQLKRILQHYDPQASTPSYAEVVFLTTGQTTAILRECERKVAAAIDGGATPQEFSQEFGVSARFAETLINRYDGMQNRRGGDRGNDASLFNITHRRTRRESLRPRLDALTAPDLSEILHEETKILSGILPKKKGPSGRVELGRLLQPLAGDTQALTAACASADYEKIGGLSDAVIADARRILEEAPETTDDARAVTIHIYGRSPQKRFLSDKNMRNIAELAEHARTEAGYWQPK
jgi:hypothetical protein